jgi:Ca-activated chloride channel family protein
MGGFSGLFVVLLVLGLPSIWAPGPAANRKGNEAFRKGQYDQAVEHYAKAMQILPGDRGLSYNTGTALLKQKKYDEALKALMAGTADPRKDVKTGALYNSGNALYEMQKYPEALSAYRESVLGDSKDMDAKFNYELAQYRLKKQQEEQKKDDKNKDKNQDQKDKNKKENQDQKNDQNQKQDQSQNQDQNQKKEENQANQEQQENKEEQQGNPQEQEAPPASLLSKQEAERLLDALKANEMEMIKARLKSTRKKNVDKDW